MFSTTKLLLLTEDEQGASYAKENKVEIKTYKRHTKKYYYNP